MLASIWALDATISNINPNKIALIVGVPHEVTLSGTLDAGAMKQNMVTVNDTTGQYRPIAMNISVTELYEDEYGNPAYRGTSKLVLTDQYLMFPYGASDASPKRISFKLTNVSTATLTLTNFKVTANVTFIHSTMGKFGTTFTG